MLRVIVRLPGPAAVEGVDLSNHQAQRIKDGEIRTACQQTCPTDAIVFGNANDPESRISKMKAHPRAFRVLEIINTKPSVHYLTKVRNVEKEGSGHQHHEEAEHGHHS